MDMVQTRSSQGPRAQIAPHILLAEHAGAAESESTKEAAYMLTQYLLNRPILEDNAGMITLTTQQYEHLKLGWGDYRVKPLGSDD